MATKKPKKLPSRQASVGRPSATGMRTPKRKASTTAKKPTTTTAKKPTTAAKKPTARNAKKSTRPVRSKPAPQPARYGGRSTSPPIKPSPERASISPRGIPDIVIADPQDVYDASINEFEADATHESEIDRGPDEAPGTSTARQSEHPAPSSHGTGRRDPIGKRTSQKRLDG